MELLAGLLILYLLMRRPPAADDRIRDLEQRVWRIEYMLSRLYLAVKPKGD